MVSWMLLPASCAVSAGDCDDTSQTDGTLGLVTGLAVVVVLVIVVILLVRSVGRGR